MLNLYIYLCIGYFAIFIAFFSAIQFERINQQFDFSIFQFIAALFWPLILVWYSFEYASSMVGRIRTRRRG